MTPVDELTRLLRPAGGGVHVVSTGRAQQETVQRRLYGTVDPASLSALHRGDLERISSADWLLLGVPSDVGAGVRRGANFGPAGIREALLRADPAWRATCERLGLVDAGDVFCVPQLLHDDMLSADQRRKSARALHPDLSDSIRDALPVSPLSIEERALDLCLTLNPSIRPLILGGDHSVAWPVVSALVKSRGPSFAIVQFDAHTDLLPERLGITYCFATWTFHANDLLGRGGRVLQLGVRASRFPREHWESTLGVKQWWAATCRAEPDRVLDEVCKSLDSLGISDVYVSDDIDGLDGDAAPATGTPEPDGLTPAFVDRVLGTLRDRYRIVGADVSEVAPPLAPPAEADRTCDLAAAHVRTLVGA